MTQSIKIPAQNNQFFSNISAHIKLKYLANLGSFRKGKGISNKDIIENGLPCVTYGMLYTKYNGKISKVYSYIDREVSKNSEQSVYGEIIFPGSGETIEEIGKASVNLLEEPIFVGGDTIIFKCDNQINPLFLSYVLNTDIFRIQTRRFGQGHSVVHIYGNDLKKIIIPVPPLPEQKKIAEILSTWDEAITKLEDLIAGAEKYQQSVVSKILSKRNIQLAHLDEWKEVPLGTLIEQVLEKTTINNQYPILTSSRKGIFLQEDYFKKSVASSNNIGYKIIKNGEFTFRAMSDDGTFKFNRLLKHEIGIVSPAYSVFKATRVEARFLDLYMNSHIFTKEIAKASQGGTRLSLKYIALAKFKLSIPNKKRQIEIANLNDDIEHYIIALREYKSKLILQKQGLMQRLLTGKILVNLD
jgi:type I restriction enzyme, S subunit